MRAADLLTPNIDDVARVQYASVPYRIGMAVVLGILSAPPLGWHAALAWLAVVLACEALTRRTARAAHERRVSLRARGAYVLSGIVTVPAWTALGVLHWTSGSATGGYVALALWAVQLLNTQRFIYQSVASIVIGNYSTVLAMAVLPLWQPRAAGADQMLLVLSIVLCLLFAVFGAAFTFRTQETLKRALADVAQEKTRVEHNATHDPLTGLGNRVLFRRALDEAAARRTTRFVVMAFDLDHFKAVNDTLGHAAGDLLLIEVAARLRRVLPPDAVIGRLGGDEFAALLPGMAEPEAALPLARELIVALGAPYAVERRRARIGVSVGIAGGGEGGTEAILRAADFALYQAKCEGRSTARVFDRTMRAQAEARGRDEAALRYAVQTAAFEIEYHPWPEGGTFDASVRWRHPERGLLPASDFTELLEEIGLDGAFAEWLLRRACRDAVGWPVAVRVAVRLGAAQLAQPRLAETVADALAAAGLPPARLELSLSQAALDELGPSAAERIAALRATGAAIAILAEPATRAAAPARAHAATPGGERAELALLRSAVARAADGAGGLVGVALVDLDHLDHLNEAHGRAAGDTALVAAATRLAAAAAPGETAMRIGGGLFALVLRGLASREEAVARLDQVQEALRRPVPCGVETLAVTTSVGLALGATGDTGTGAASRLLREAELALCAAKGDGRDTMRLMEQATEIEVNGRGDLLESAAAGLARGEFELFYQPVVDLASGRATGFEALMRWRHPAHGLLAPAAFETVLTDRTLGPELGEHMLDAALKQMRAWLDAGVPFGRVAVNVAAAQFRAGDFAGAVARRLAYWGVPAERLGIEITEGIYLGLGADDVARAIRALHVIGVQIALDDFGTGQASLAHLRRFPIDRLKIDRMFVQAEDRAIVGAILSLGRDMGIEVVAEGVETAAQLAFARATGATAVQGFLHAEPMPAAAVAGFLARPADDGVAVAAA